MKQPDVQEFTLSKRLLWAGVVGLIQAIYFPASQATSGGIAPKLPIDVFPVLPVWVVPYYLIYAVWAFGAYWALFKLDARSFRALTVAALFTVSVGALTFVFFPTYIELPVIVGDDLFAVMLRSVQVAGGAYAALPSAHNYITMLMAAFAMRLYPRQCLLWIAVVVIVALSTLFTGQHYILDVVTGLALGWVGYKIGWIFTSTSLRRQGGE
ncbi:MAG: phosphatase PAP2 family protein [Chloroflexota bacterium]